MKSTQTMTNADDAGELRARTLVTGEATGGRLALIEVRETAGQEPPRHLHANDDEIVYVLEGDLTFYVGDDARRAGVGACLLLPRGIEHGYAVESGSARLLVLLSPAGLEGFYRELDGRPNLERLIAVAARYGLAITGPPPAGWADRPDGDRS